MTTNVKNTRGRRPTVLLGVLIAAATLVAVASPAPALAAPVLQIDSSHYPATVPAGTYARFELIVRNAGDANTSGDFTVDFTVPPELRVVRVSPESVNFGGSEFALWSCSTPDFQTASCFGPDLFGHIPVEPGKEACKDALIFGFIPVPRCRIYVTVKADESASPGTIVPAIHTSGGGSADFNGTDPIDIGPPPHFALTSFDGEALDSNGDPATQAGSHPAAATTQFSIATAVGATGAEIPVEQLKDALVELPPGLVGNPQAIPACTQAQLAFKDGQACPYESQVGVVTVHTTSGDAIGTFVQGVYQMERPGGSAAVPIGTPALFAFSIQGVRVQVYAKLRTGGDYGVTVISKNAPQTLQVDAVDFGFWGVPADPAHDVDRGYNPSFGFCGAESNPSCSNPSTAPIVPFLTLPTSCTGPVETFLDVVSWSDSMDSSSFITAPGGTGCPTVPFAPSIEARPTTNVGDAPSGLDVDLEIPQSDNPNISATAHLKDTTVTLPEGLVINPSGANGLDGCSLAEFGYTSTDPDGTIHTTAEAARCPDASKVAEVEVNTPVLDHPIKGSAHIADPYQNPFNSLLALYITLDDPETGIVAKLAGKVSADPNTGRLTTSFEENPQLPFESFRLHFKSGAHGTLRTPAICGDYTTEATLNPWSSTGGALAVDRADTWSIDQNCVNSPGEQPNAPSFDAGTISPIAARHSPFVLHLRREDGSQNFSAVTVSPPQGLVAKLAGTAICSDADLSTAASKSGAGEKASPSCPASSEVGSVDAGAGAGPAPYHAPGKVYMAGPYKGAPLSFAIVTPATAGPFDLGTIVVRTALYVDSKTAQIRAVSDPIPSILQGIPLDVRTVDISLDRPDFTLTGTSCNVSAVNGLLTSTLNQIASLSSRYQLAECTGLGFKPKMTLNLKGGTKRGKYPQLTIDLMPRPGDANIASVSVAMPRSEFLANEHIRTVCTRPDFAADACPAGAIYGEATVDTPILDYDLSGHAYLRSSDNLLPDLVTDLRGPSYQPIKLETAGRTDSIRGGIRTTIDFVPDAPFIKATVALQGGNKGLLVNSRNICAKTYRATVKYTAHNGLSYTAHPALRAKCGRKAKKSKRRGHRRR